jgi:hypothetical protein
MAIIHGRQLIVKQNGTPIAVQKSCDIDVRCAGIPVSAQTYGQWEKNIAGRKSWTMTCNTLVTSIKSNVDMVGQTVTINCGVDNDTVSGSALITGWKVTGTIGNLAQAVASFLGSGPLT